MSESVPFVVANLGTLLHPDFIDAVVSFVCRIVEAADIKVVTSADQVMNTIEEMVVIDRKFNQLTLLDVVGNDHVAKVQKAFKQCREITVKAQVVLKEDRKSVV